MRLQMGPLARQLEESFELVFPDAPHLCSAAATARLWARERPPRGVRTPRTWWNATEDGAKYEGWQQSVDSLRPLLARSQPVAVLGFSQGAMLAATLAALSEHGEIPALACGVFLCGSAPRAVALRPYFSEPLQLPSLHVYGQRDTLMKDAPRHLAECFEAQGRQVVEFDGGHVVPRRGEAAQRIVDFLSAAVLL